MDNYQYTCKLSKYSENFHKFDKYDLYSIPIALYDFTMVFINSFYELGHLEYSPYDSNLYQALHL